MDEIDYSFTMEDFFGDECEIFVMLDGSAIVRYFDYEITYGTKYKSFEDKTAAYAWAYRHGFRE